MEEMPSGTFPALLLLRSHEGVMVNRYVPQMRVTGASRIYLCKGTLAEDIGTVLLEGWA